MKAIIQTLHYERFKFWQQTSRRSWGEEGSTEVSLSLMTRKSKNIGETATDKTGRQNRKRELKSLPGVSERHTFEQGWMWSMYENMSAVKQCLSISPEALLIAATFTQREKERVKTGIRECREQWAHMHDRAEHKCDGGLGRHWSVSDPGPQEVWWIKRRWQRQRPSLNRGANPSETTSPSLSISLMVSLSLSLPFFSCAFFLNRHLNSPFSLPLLNPLKIAIKPGNHASATLLPYCVSPSFWSLLLL